MRVLVGCEFSGIVRQAFRAEGHDAYSCDLLDSLDSSPHHIKGNILDVIGDGWDLAIFHPPCTYLTVSANRYMLPEWAHKFPNRPQQREEAIQFVKALYHAPIPFIAIENPIGVLSSRWMKPTQVIQPWMFGHEEKKATCLWLKLLPKLKPTQVMAVREAVCHRESPGPDRWKRRSVTYPGIAQAMAQQWGNL